MPSPSCGCRHTLAQYRTSRTLIPACATSARRQIGKHAIAAVFALPRRIRYDPSLLNTLSQYCTPHSAIHQPSTGLRVARAYADSTLRSLSTARRRVRALEQPVQTWYRLVLSCSTKVVPGPALAPYA
eukprot:3587517-Rhodomonas_salina.1